MTTPKSFPPIHEVTMYQARCTTCGTIEDDYGDFSAWSDADTPRNSVVESFGWFERWTRTPNPTPDNLHGQTATLEELLCVNCLKCEVCESSQAYEMDEHLVCADHEDHDFSAVLA